MAIDLNAIVRRVLLRHEPELISLQRSRLSKGKYVEGYSFGGYRSDSYKSKRNKAGLQTNFVNLNFTGENYSKLFADVKATETEFGTKAQHERVSDFQKVIEWRYDNGEVYGATIKEINKAIPTFKEEVIEEYRKDFLKKI